MKVIFMGTPDFSVPALKKLIEAGHDIIAVYTQKPKAAGRGMELKKSKVHEVAEANNLKVFTPDSLKSDEEKNNFRNLNADIAVVAAYGMLLPREILNGTKYGCINIHPSLLPRLRGAAPLQRSIMAGDKRTGICIMKMDEGLDTGDVILKEEFDIIPEDANTGWLHDKCADMGADLTLKALELIESNQATYAKQSEIGITYAKKIIKEDELIDFNKKGDEIVNKIRALAPSPGANFTLEGKKYKVFDAIKGNVNSDKEAGTILNDKFHITCADGVIVPEIIQKEGKGRMSIEEFLKGNKVSVGTKIT